MAGGRVVNLAADLAINRLVANHLASRVHSRQVFGLICSDNCEGGCLISSVFAHHVFVDPSPRTPPLTVGTFLCSQSPSFDCRSERNDAPLFRRQCSERDQSVWSGHGRNYEAVKVVRNRACDQFTKRTRVATICALQRP